MPTLEEILAGAKLPETSVRLCLNGELTAELEQAERELAAASRVIPTSLSGATGVQDATARVEAARAAVQEQSVTFRLRGITSRRWSDLVAENPPRDGNAGDRALGYNSDTLFENLVSACLVDPQVSSPQELEALIDALSAGQWDVLVEAAIAVSRRKVDVPFSPPASPPTEASD